MQHKATIQRRFWNPLYDRLAWFYDGVDWFTGNMTQRLRQPVVDALPDTPARVLEIGIGTGRLHTQLAANYTMAGLDLAPGMARRTQHRLNSAGLRSALTVGSVYHMPWPDAHFDAVCSTFAFSAFADADRALEEMIRVTAQGGHIIIVDAGAAMDGNPVADLLAGAWSAMGDYMRDERLPMAARGLATSRRDYGPFRSVHIVVGVKS